VSANSTSRTIAAIVESTSSCGAAGEWTYEAAEGTTIAATDRIISTVTLRARSESRFCGPCFSPPTMNERPMTRSRLPRMEPIRAARTTSTSPAFRANSEMNSSGRLPRPDCNTPVAPGPNRLPSCSTDRPTSVARSATESAAHARAATAPPPS
jgi:hypothetical protein